MYTLQLYHKKNHLPFLKKINIYLLKTEFWWSKNRSILDSHGYVIEHPHILTIFMEIKKNILISQRFTRFSIVCVPLIFKTKRITWLWNFCGHFHQFNWDTIIPYGAKIFKIWWWLEQVGLQTPLVWGHSKEWFPHELCVSCSLIVFSW